MIKIFTDHNYLIDSNKRSFFPLFDELLIEDSILKEKYVFVDIIDDCEVIILPLSIDYLLENKNKKLVNQFMQYSKESNKPLWVFSSGDIGLTIRKENVYVFRVADFESERYKNSIIMPAFIDDPYLTIYHSEVTYLNKNSSPIVGYVGHAKGGFIKYIKLFLIYLKYNCDVFTNKIYSDYFKLYSSSHIRIKYLKILQKSKEITTNFIFRDKYRAGVKTEADKIRTTLEFFDNIKKSHYTFCIRGGGNFSVRLYETLAMGRIPVQVDTDCSLPLNDFVDWNKHCLIINEKDINQIGSKINHFNSNLSELEFLERQKSNRFFWQNYLTRINFFSIIHDLFLSKKL